MRKNEWDEIHLEHQNSEVTSSTISLDIKASKVYQARNLLTRIDLKVKGMVIEVVFVSEAISRQHLVLPKKQLIRFLKVLLVKFSDADWGIDCWMLFVDEASREYVKRSVLFH